MASVNKVILVGNVGKDPDVRYTQKGDAIVSFSLATSEKYKDKEETQWHRVDVFGALANAIKDFVKKGRQVYVEGQLVYEEWVDKDGNKRNSTKVKVGFNGKLIMLGKAEAGDQKQPVKREPVGSASGSGAAIPDEDEIPF